MTAYGCAPSLHDGDAKEADYFVMRQPKGLVDSITTLRYRIDRDDFDLDDVRSELDALIKECHQPVAGVPFACCGEHLQYFVESAFDHEPGHLVIRRVPKEVETNVESSQAIEEG